MVKLSSCVKHDKQYSDSFTHLFAANIALLELNTTWTDYLKNIQFLVLSFLHCCGFPCRSTATSSGDCKETETHMGRLRHAPRQPLQNHPSGHPRRWATPWLSNEMRNKQRQRLDVPIHTRTAHDGFSQKKTGRESVLNRPSCPPGKPIGLGTELNCGLETPIKVTKLVGMGETHWN